VLPPAGGFGMNTGIQDAHNLAWRLATALRIQAQDAATDVADDAGGSGETPPPTAERALAAAAATRRAEGQEAAARLLEGYHLRVRSIPTGTLAWLRFPYLFESWRA
jgi:hypothetical protein